MPASASIVAAPDRATVRDGVVFEPAMRVLAALMGDERNR
jgi:hypothetical protein